MKDYIGYTNFLYTRASATVLGKLDGHELPSLVDGGSEICIMNEEIAREFNIRWNRAGWKMITADDNWSDLTKVAESVPLNVHGIVIPVTICVAKSGSEQVIMGRHGESYT